jgi:hypothetical protein
MMILGNYAVMIVLTAALFRASTLQASVATPEITVFNDNGGWCWFQDERAIVLENRLVFASVANTLGTDGARRGGNIEVTSVDLAGKAASVTTVLHAQLEDDDHDAPALLALGDGRILAVYSRHGTDRLVRFRISAHPGDATSWQPEGQFSREAPVTYSNLFLLRNAGRGRRRIYNFYRGEYWNPNWIVSDDMGQSWQYGGRLIAFDGRPYVKYASNGLDTIHFVATEHHPHNYPDSIYHAYLKNGKLHKSDGTVIRAMDDAPIEPEQATMVFAGDVDHVAWPCDIHLDSDGNPCIAYSVQKQLDPSHIRFRYARWDGHSWDDHFLAHAGTALYAGEEHYSGLIALDPTNPSRLYISSDADPVTGEPLISYCDGRRHYEIFEGRTADRGATWRWRPITRDSTADNIRPIVPACCGDGNILLWLRGTYTSYTRYDLDVAGIVDKSDPW